MKKKILVLLVLLTASCFGEVNLRDHPSFVDKIEFFYVDPTPEDAKEILKEALDLKCLDYLGGVTTALAKQYPQDIIKWMGECGIQLKKHPYLVRSIYTAGLQEQTIQAALQAGWSPNAIISLRNKPKPLLDVSADFPGGVGFMSELFFITGDDRYISKIIDLLENPPSDSEGLKQFNETKQVAIASLKNLVFKHNRIYELLLKESKNRTGKTQNTLTLIIDELHDLHRKNLTEGKEMFKGMVLVTDDLDFDRKWEQMPVMSGPFDKPISSIPYPVEKEASVAIHILFTGAALDQNLNTHVTCDIEVFDPNGDKMFGEYKIPALMGKVASRFFVQKVEWQMGFKMEPYTEGCERIYSTGIYTIRATLKDHINQNEIKLQQTFELLSNEIIDAI